MKNQALFSSKDKRKKLKCPLLCFSEKIRLDVSSESSARQRIHMKNQALFSWKDKSKKLKCHLLQFLFGALRVNEVFKKITISSILHCQSRAHGRCLH